MYVCIYIYICIYIKIYIFICSKLNIVHTCRGDKGDALSANIFSKQSINMITTSEDMSDAVPFDVDLPNSELDPKGIQRVLHLLDKLDATTDPSSRWFGKSAEARLCLFVLVG
jgi:hypothetical protein